MMKLGRSLVLSLLLVAPVFAPSSAIAEQVFRIVALSSDQSVGESLNQKYEFKAELSIGIAGRQGKDSLRGTVTISPFSCMGFATASGYLRLYENGNASGHFIEVIDLPLAPRKIFFGDRDQEASQRSEEDSFVLGRSPNLLPVGKRIPVSGTYQFSPLQWIDVDGDGDGEFLVEQLCGNRHSPQVNIYDYDPASVRGFVFNASTKEEIRPHSKRFETWWGSGMCLDEKHTHQSINGRYELVELYLQDYLEDHRPCFERTYKRGRDGQFCLVELVINDQERKLPLKPECFPQGGKPRDLRTYSSLDLGEKP